MDQFDKVEEGLECCIPSIQECQCVDGCPYYDSCWNENDECDPMYLELMRDALALIRQQAEKIHELQTNVHELQTVQTARLITEKDFEKADCWGNIPAWYEHNPSIKIKTIDGWGIIKPENLRDRMTRYWTECPTDEQREAVPWNE